MSKFDEIINEKLKLYGVVCEDDLSTNLNPTPPQATQTATQNPTQPAAQPAMPLLSKLSPAIQTQFQDAEILRNPYKLGKFITALFTEILNSKI